LFYSFGPTAGYIASIPGLSISLQTLSYSLDKQYGYILYMANVKRAMKRTSQNMRTKAKTAKDKMKGKASSSRLNKAKVKAHDAKKDLKRRL